MNPITIKPLTPELNKDYLDFFDNRAFTDGNPNGPCYCTSPNQDEERSKDALEDSASKNASLRVLSMISSVSTSLADRAALNSGNVSRRAYQGLSTPA